MNLHFVSQRMLCETETGRGLGLVVIIPLQRRPDNEGLQFRKVHAGVERSRRIEVIQLLHDLQGGELLEYFLRLHRSSM